MTKVQRRLLEVLSTGYQSGEELGALLGVSRAAVWKQVQALEELGFGIESERGKGYRLIELAELLSESQIRAGIGPEASALLVHLECADIIPSTNDRLLALASQGVVSGGVCLAEQQTKGKGRRGRVWQGGYGRNILMSTVGRFDQGIAEAEGLSLAVGVVVAEVLSEFGASGVGLKWPNDLMLGGKKLGGILLEMGGDPSGECFVVVGLGLNVSLPEAELKAIDQPAIDLASLAVSVSRNALVARLVDRLLLMLDDYAASGFSAYRSRWEALNVFSGRSVVIDAAAMRVEGLMLGVSDSGAVVLDVEGVSREFLGGEISLREV